MFDGNIFRYSQHQVHWCTAFAGGFMAMGIFVFLFCPPLVVSLHKLAFGKSVQHTFAKVIIIPGMGGCSN